MNVHLTLQLPTRKWWRRGVGHSIKGERSQAIGRSRGGRTTKIHALTDACCRPIAFLLTGGQVADCIAADELVGRLLSAEILHGDKSIRQQRCPPEDREQGRGPQHPT